MKRWFVLLGLALTFLSGGVSVLVTEVATASWTGLEELPVVPDEVAQ